MIPLEAADEFADRAVLPVHIRIDHGVFHRAVRKRAGGVVEVAQITGKTADLTRFFWHIDVGDRTADDFTAGCFDMILGDETEHAAHFVHAFYR